jgi:5-methylcytosine-specific restriction endonuclease McrA
VFALLDQGVSKDWAKGSTRAWRRRRALVLARDRGVCQLRLEGCTIVATHVHHTHGRSVTGDDLRYLVAACAHCNLKIGDPTKHADPPNRGVTSW